MGAADIFGVADTYAVYGVTLQFRELVVGGIPSDPSIIEGWLRSRLGDDVPDAWLQELLADTIRERDEAMTIDEQVSAVMGAGAVSVNGFKRNPNGELCIEGRIVKAMLKEAANSAYPGTDWPGKKKHDATKGLRKGLMRYVAESVFVDPALIGLGVKSDDVSGTPGHNDAWVEERVKHIMTPQGPRSAINRVEVVQRPQVEFQVKVRDDFLPGEAWGRIWTVAEDIGLGSDRGRSDGRFELLSWEPLS